MFDYEGSSSFYKGSGDVVDIKSICKAENCGPIRATELVIESLKESGKKYQFCIVDTISKINEHAEKLALFNYKKTPQGKNFNGQSVMTLAHGAGK